MKTRKVIKIEVPQEIWDADLSWWNTLMGRDLVGAWMKSIRETVEQLNNKQYKYEQRHKNRRE
jgi:hypothetical protein